MQITWYGHAAFRLDFAGKAVLIDPFFTGNPVFVSDKAQAIKDVSHIVLTHGHGDHVGDALDIAKTNGATVTANYDLGMWLVSKGLEKLNPMNTGGTTDLGGFTVSMVRADHSSGDMVDGTPIYLGNPLGAIIKAPGEPTVYHFGDTDIFSDMELIAEIHQPKVAIVPIGDRFTMGGADRGVSGEALFQARRGHSLPFWDLSIPGSDAGQVRRRHEGPQHQGHRAGEGQAGQRLIRRRALTKKTTPASTAGAGFSMTASPIQRSV